MLFVLALVCGNEPKGRRSFVRALDTRRRFLPYDARGNSWSMCMRLPATPSPVNPRYLRPPLTANGLRYLNLYRLIATPKAAPNAIPKMTPRAILCQMKPNIAPVGSARERAKVIDLCRLFIRRFRLIP